MIYWMHWTHPLLSRAWRLNCGHACAFGRVDEAVSGGKPLAEKGVVGLLSWHGSHFWVCITFCKVRHGDSVTKPDYYYYYYYIGVGFTCVIEKVSETFCDFLSICQAANNFGVIWVFRVEVRMPNFPKTACIFTAQRVMQVISDW